MSIIHKFSLIITTRCNLKCRLCCEYVPANKPFPDISVDEASNILEAAFDVFDTIDTLHLTGGGEPFLHSDLPELIKICMKPSWKERINKLMLLTNCTIPVSPELLSTLTEYKDKIVVQVSRYNVMPEREEKILEILNKIGVMLKVENYHGENQSFGGWLDFGSWESHGRSSEELLNIFRTCSVTKVLKGNWRTRDGKVHWCSRSQRGMELGLIPDESGDYVDLLDTTLTSGEKRAKFECIAKKKYLSACDYCSGDAGTEDKTKRFKAAEQMKGELY